MLNEFATNYPILAQTLDALALLLLPVAAMVSGFLLHKTLEFFGQ
jgi:hypothetical protein